MISASQNSHRPMINKNIILNILLIAVLVFFLCLVFLNIGGKISALLMAILISFSMSLWGHIIFFPLRNLNFGRVEKFVWGCILGTAVTALTISILVYVFGWNLELIFIFNFLIPALVLVILYSSKARKQSIQSSHEMSFCSILIVLIIVTLFFIFPYKNLGILIGDYYVFPWLFGHDFINRIVHVDSLSRGLPLQGMFFAGETLSYYWLGYILPALICNFKSINLEIQQILQIVQLYYSFLASLGLVCLLYRYATNNFSFSMALIIGFCCYSYVWIINFVGPLTELIDRNFEFSFFSIFSFDLSNYSGFSHGLYRFFLVEPQSILALGLIFMILRIYNESKLGYNWIVIGISIGLLFGVEATNGIMIMMWYCSLGIVFLIFDNNRMEIFINHFIGGCCAVGIYAVLFAIEMYSFTTGKGALQLSPNWFALKSGILYFPISYGPPFLFAMAGLVLMVKRRESVTHWSAQAIALLAVGFFFVFFIQNPTEYHFGLLKATRVIPVALLLLAVYFLQNVATSNKVYTIVFLLTFAALPTYITDNRVASNSSHPSTFVSVNDMRAAKWMRQNIPEDAIVQAEPNYPGKDENGIFPKYAYSFIPVFAQRKTAIGEWKVSQQEHARPDEVQERFHTIRHMFETSSTSEAVEIANRYDIDYIYVGELERKLYGKSIDKFNESNDYDLIYSVAGVKIYHKK